MSDNLCSLRKELDEQYHESCVKQWDAYEACGERIKASKEEGANCEGWYHDYLKCLDNHVSILLYIFKTR